MDGHDLLDEKTGIIFGALNEDSIAWSIARACHREGADFVLSNAPVARRLGNLNELAEETDSDIIWADATDDEELADLFAEVKDTHGTIDFIVHSIGMGVNVRKDVPYDDLNYNWYEQTLDVSAVSLHRIVNHALDTETIDDGGSILAMTYIGAQRIFSKYSEMGDAKALLESIVRSFGYRLGERNIRINAISQSPTKTTAGAGIEGFDAMYEFAERVAPLGNASADECADYAVTLLSDLTRMVTMQTLYHDGGFSSMGISDEIVEAMEESFADKDES